MGHKLTAEQVRHLLDYNPITGDLTWRNPTSNKVAPGDAAGFVGPDGCRYVTITDAPFRAHRVVWLHAYGENPVGRVHARNGNTADLRLDNLYVQSPRVLDAEKAHKLERQKERARLEGLWRRMLADYGSTAWTSIEAFAADIGSVPSHHTVVAANPASPVGPGNFTLTPRSKFDRSTPEGRAAYLKSERENNRERYWGHHLRSNFGIGTEEYKAMLIAQKGVCAICHQPETAMRLGKLLVLAVDHCHTTGAIRGLLCRDCNHTLGKMKEDSTALRRAADYLDHHAAKQNSVPASNVVHLKQKER